jgi:acetate kinase
MTRFQAERIGQEMGTFTIKYNGEKHVTNLPLPDHKAAVNLLLKSLTDLGVVEHLDEIKGAGHRIVQGGTLDFRYITDISGQAAGDVEFNIKVVRKK